MNHLITEEILSYIVDKTSEEKSFEIDNHLADCNMCREKVYNYHILREHFDVLWNSWTAKSHAEEALQLRVMKALEGTEITSGIRKRLVDWMRRISGKTEASFQIILDSSKKTARILREGMEGLSGTGVSLSFSPVSCPTRIMGSDEEGTVAVEAQGPPWIRIAVDSTAGKVTIQGSVQRASWPIAFLLPKGEGKAFVEEFRQTEGTDYILAEFEEVPDGEYFLLLKTDDEIVKDQTSEQDIHY